MPGVVEREDGDQGAEEVGVDLRCGCAARVEGEGDEADGEVERLPRDLMAVNEAAPVPVDGDEAEWGRGAGYWTPGREGGGG